MSYQEKKVFAEIISAILSFGGYSIYVYFQYQEMGPDILNDIVYWSKTFLWLIPIGALAGIIVMVIFAIMDRIITREENDPTFLDERDKAIEYKAQFFAFWVFIMGIFLGMIFIVLGKPAAFLFITIAVVGFISSMVSNILKIIYYRKGL